MEELGKKYGKPDLERLGVFIEMPYMNGKGYVSPFEKPKCLKGKNMLPGGPKIKDGTTAAYFDKEFKRVFEGEAVSRHKPKLKSPLKPFLPIGMTKLHSSPGDYYGTFSGNIEAFSNVRKQLVASKREGKNFMTSPVKRGGPGYVNICLNPYPEHFSNIARKVVDAKSSNLGRRAMIPIHWPQPCFDKNPYREDSGKLGPTYIRPRGIGSSKLGKWVPNGPAKTQGGCHDGCFNKFPDGMPDKYVSEFDANKKKVTQGKYFYPQSMAMKTKQTTSVLYQNTDRSVNVQNYETYSPNYIKYLVD